MKRVLVRHALRAIVWLALCASGVSVAAADGPAVVRVVATADGHQLQVDGTPFRIRGAGLQDGDQEALAARGANSFRTWHTADDAVQVRAMLDRAQRNGLMVAMGLHVGKERHGFDFGDAAAIAAQQARLLEQVRAYKNHPAVLMWVVGNELNLEGRDPRVWNAVEAITRAIHAEDPNHPVMTPLAGFDPALADLLRTRAPSLDLIGVQLYGDIVDLPRKLEAARWDGPYVVTEWGPTGHWESPLTSWGAPVEDDASRKAALLVDRYTRIIEADAAQGLGSYVFLWGQKQERTPTWYGLFLPGGESTPGVDAMQQLWTGRWPANRAPAISPLRIDARVATDSVVLVPDAEHRAHVVATDPDGDPLVYRWIVREESRATSIGGDPETLPPQVPLRLAEHADGALRFSAPTTPGAYRLFVEVRDGQGHAAYANVPFHVGPPPAQ
ncbi:MAG: glycoside hydrolase family 2 TIM barrel-domain containing protein [Luteimonas sp.]